MAFLEKYKIGSTTNLMTTELNGIVNNSTAISSSPYNNTVDGYLYADIRLVASFVSAPSLNTGVAIWFLSTLDNTNYEDGVEPQRFPAVILNARSVTSVQTINRRILLPWGNFKTFIKNLTGVAFSSSDNVLSIRPVTLEV